MTIDWQHAKNILCIRPDNMGDVLMCTPAIRALKESVEGRRVTLLASPAGAKIASMVPEIDDVMIETVPWVKTTSTSGNEVVSHLIEELKAKNFDAAVIFTTYSQSALPAALMCYMAQVPLRLAYSHENPYQLLTHWIPDPEPASFIRHEVIRQISLVSSINAASKNTRLSLHIPSQDIDRALDILKKENVQTDKPWILVHPGATAPSRRYPAHLFAEVISILARRHHVQVILTGSHEDKPIIDEIMEKSGSAAISLAGKTDIFTFAGLIHLAPLLIANNSVGIHIASATGTPVVVLYALTNIQHVPWKVPNKTLFHDVPCKLCYKSVCPMKHHACLSKVLPQTVVDAALELMSNTTILEEDHGILGLRVSEHEKEKSL